VFSFAHHYHVFLHLIQTCIIYLYWCALHYAGLSVPPSSWTIISEDRQTRVLVAKDRELYVLKQSEQDALRVVS
jgi:hypothetical protein